MATTHTSLPTGIDLTEKLATFNEPSQPRAWASSTATT